MTKVVLKWPLRLTSAGVFETDEGFRTGMRLLTTFFRKTILGKPDKGLSISFLEQSVTDFEADAALLLTMLFIDITAFMPTISILEVKSFKDPNNERGRKIQVKYLSQTTMDKVFVFNFALPLQV